LRLPRSGAASMKGAVRTAVCIGRRRVASCPLERPIRRRTMSAEANKAIADMTREEAMEALPRLREEASRANARVHEAVERVAATEDVPTHIDVHGDHLVVSVRGKELSMTFLNDLRIPLEHVRGVEADPEIEHTLWRGWRVPGGHLPRVRFYDVHGHRDKTLVIHLHDETYDRLIVEVQDQADVVAKVNEALEASRNA